MNNKVNKPHSNPPQLDTEILGQLVEQLIKVLRLQFIG